MAALALASDPLWRGGRGLTYFGQGRSQVWSGQKDYR